jgi:hypothetical protein
MDGHMNVKIRTLHCRCYNNSPIYHFLDVFIQLHVTKSLEIKYYLFILRQAKCLIRVKSSRLKGKRCDDVLSD